MRSKTFSVRVADSNGSTHINVVGDAEAEEVILEIRLRDNYTTQSTVLTFAVEDIKEIVRALENASIFVDEFAAQYKGC